MALAVAIGAAFVWAAGDALAEGDSAAAGADGATGAGVGAASGAPAGAAGGGAGGVSADATSVAKAACSACLVITTILMRRLIGLCGSALLNKTDDDNPTTREIFSSGNPPATSARRAAFARSADSSQLVYPLLLGYGRISVCPVRLMRFGTESR